MEKAAAIVYTEEVNSLGEGVVMLFEKNMEARCSYCKRSAPLDRETVMCPKRGVMSASDSCRQFRYDPLKRVPPKPAAADFSHLKDEDFTL